MLQDSFGDAIFLIKKHARDLGRIWERGTFKFFGVLFFSQDGCWITFKWVRCPYQIKNRTQHGQASWHRYKIDFDWFEDPKSPGVGPLESPRPWMASSHLVAILVQTKTFQIYNSQNPSQNKHLTAKRNPQDLKKHSILLKTTQITSQNYLSKLIPKLSSLKPSKTLPKAMPKPPKIDPETVLNRVWKPKPCKIDPETVQNRILEGVR